MFLASLATPVDHHKMSVLQETFADILHQIHHMPLRRYTKRQAMRIVRAASKAGIYDGEPEAIVRKYYAFSGTHDCVWFSLDLLTLMPDCSRRLTRARRREITMIVKNILGLLLNEVRYGLRDELGL